MRLPTLQTISLGLRATFVRFPIPTSVAALTTALLVLAIGEDFDESHIFRLAFLTGLGFVASLLCDLVAEARGASGRNRLIGHTGILILLLLYGRFFMPEFLDEARPPFWYGYFILLFALHLGIALVPAIGKSGSEKLWRFNLNCFLRYFFSSVNAALLFGGLALALLSVDKLFELGLDDELYPQLWVICALFAHPMLFLSGLPRIDSPEEATDFPKPLRFSLCFIGLPLVALYLLILYAYIAKIGIQWSWPNGWVAMPIFVLAVISLLTFVLSLPLPKTENWARFFHRWLFRALLPLSVVLFLALQVRLGDYGMTINRYLGLALAVWLFGLSLAYIIRPALKIAWMPFSLLLIALLSIYSGPIGAFGWSERAQMGRIQNMAEEFGVLKNGILVPSTGDFESERVAELQSALRYLFENFGPQPLEAELAGFYKENNQSDFSSKRSYNMTSRVMKYLELNDKLSGSRKNFYANRNVMPTHGHEWMVDLDVYSYRNNETSRSVTVDGRELLFTTNLEESRLTITADGTSIIEIDTNEWANELHDRIKTSGPDQTEPVFWQANAGDWAFTFGCTNAQLNSQGDRFQSARFTIFLTLPD
ncbi:MAG: DUF4153 domain-containing protein [Verrucomicrobiota bacterium]